MIVPTAKNSIQSMIISNEVEGEKQYLTSSSVSPHPSYKTKTTKGDFLSFK